MADHQDFQGITHAEQNETVFLFRMIRVVDQFGAIIMEGRLRFLEADAVLAEIGGGLLGALYICQGSKTSG
ncbi:MAG: hypothetical protein Q8M20_02195 [Rhodocyclaceae bacterium]|nr:hypothetical protein [Rhodocyclaceae bacterium]MDZ4213192.1 hypothetical protein [Rhodocyclaceae bacterium]